MKIKDLQSKTEADLRKLLGEKRAALKTFRFNIAGSKIKNVKEGRMLRKEIAQILTLLNQQSNSN